MNIFKEIYTKLSYLKKIVFNKSSSLQLSEILFLAPSNGFFLKVNDQYYIPQLDHLILKLEKFSIATSLLIYPNNEKPNFNTASDPKQYLSIELLISMKMYWEKVLSITSPKLIVGIGLPPALLKIAKQKKIKTIEISHFFGLKPIGRYSLECRNKLSYWEPYLYILNDDISLKTLEMGELALVERTMHPYFERKKFFLSNNIDTIKITKDEIGKRFQNDNKIVLISLQWGYAGEEKEYSNIINNGVIHEELIKLIKKRSDLNWILRWHPVQIERSRYKEDLQFIKNTFYGFSNVAFDEFNNVELLDIIQLSNIHITMISMTAREAAYFNVPSICLCPTLLTFNKDFFSDLFQNGIAKYCELNSKIIESTLDEFLTFQNKNLNDYQMKEEKYPLTFEVICNVYQKTIYNG